MEIKQICLGHGSGGAMSRDLLENVIRPAFSNPILDEMHDGARFSINNTDLAFTTDSYVIKPLFFPGGDIGKLAVCGTVNDLAMAGAIPLYISVGLIIEEGFLISDLQRIITSMHQAAQISGVSIITGDTKVVNKKAADGIYINTAGIGQRINGTNIGVKQIMPGQRIIVSGFIGDHAATIMAHRHDLEMPAALQSDCAPLNELVRKILLVAPNIAMLRDPTRGGVAAVLNEIAVQANLGILLEENYLPIRPAVAGFCDLLGFDPLYLANEGKFIAFVDKADVDQVLRVMHTHPYGQDACVIGQVTKQMLGKVGIRTTIGGIRLIDMPEGELLPRIC